MHPLSDFGKDALKELDKKLKDGFFIENVSIDTSLINFKSTTIKLEFTDGAFAIVNLTTKTKAIDKTFGVL